MKNAAVKAMAKAGNGGKPDPLPLDKQLAHVLSTKCRITNVRRSSSASSDESRNRRRKDKKSSRRSRTRSRDRYSRTRRSRSRESSSHHSSKSKHHRSASKDTYRDRDRDRDRHRRSSSRDRHRSRRSRSKSYIREYVSKSKRRSSESSSSSERSTKTKTKPSSSNSKTSTKGDNSSNISSVPKKEPIKSPTVSTFDSKILDEINEDMFTPKAFNSSKKVPDNIVIDLTKNTIKIPEVEPSEPDSIFHHNLFQSEELRMEKWVKELFCFRQKALQQGSKK
nr:unnamed protein product [Callosobruchus chinensis]